MKPSIRGLRLSLFGLASLLALAGCQRQAAQTWELENNIKGFLPDLKFSLASKEKDPVTEADYQGKVVLLYFGYTHCPDVCPMTMAKLGKVLNQMGSQANDVQLIFVSVDPKRDTPELLEQYATAFYPKAVGLTGNSSQIEDIAKRFRVAYQADAPDSSGNYDVMHSKAVYVFDRAGHARFMITDADTNDSIVHDLGQLVAAR